MSELGPDNFNFTIALDRLFCYQPSDNDAIWPWASADEPYMWVFMIKIDGNGLYQEFNANYLSGEATYFFSNGVEGNLGGKADTGFALAIPKAIGTWETSLKSIPISVSGIPVTKIPGQVIVGAVLLEENLTPNSAVAAAHQSTVKLIKDTVQNTIASIGLAGLGADAAVDYEAAKNTDKPLTIEAAAAGVLYRRLKPIMDLFNVAGTANAISTVLRSSGFGGLVGSAIDKDEVLGVYVRTFSQKELAATRDPVPGSGEETRIKLSDNFWELHWAYSMYGTAFAHRKYVWKGLPTSKRLEVKWTVKRRKLTGDHGIRIVSIAGDDNGAGETWIFTREWASARIASGEYSFYVKGPGEHIVEVRSVLSFLQTDSDEYASNNLKNLPDIPEKTSVGNWKEVWY